MAGFRRVYVANRGEIAVRVIRALRERGIESVIGCSEADTGSLAVELADQAVLLGPPSPSESYLDIERVVKAAVKTGCDAVHPGYGFLSERPPFAAALAEAGIAFIGPPADLMEILGDKIRARKAATRAGVPVVPGTEAAVTPVEALSAAQEIGFPLLVKAAAGGGGRGMRLVERAEDLQEGIRAASREAEGSFGDGTVFLERYLVQPRHVEFQILADSHGNVVHVFERECSIQRRHQKVIEEAPAPLTPKFRARMGEAAVSLCREVGYLGAGTVEFLLAGEEFFFLEMNTRIQVEHPVTEQITGVDLIEEQLDIAAGGKLPFIQEDLKIRGHSMEARIYAEDPAGGFVPCPGELLLLEFPHTPGVRIDRGFRTGDTISEHYDSMIAKMVAFGRNRDHARRRLIRALKDTAVLGVTTNVGYLLDILEHEEFARGECDVHCLERWFPSWERRQRSLPVALATASMAEELAPRVAIAEGGGGDAPRSTPWDYLGRLRL